MWLRQVLQKVSGSSGEVEGWLHANMAPVLCLDCCNSQISPRPPRQCFVPYEPHLVLGWELRPIHHPDLPLRRGG